jgi:signal transduction histidine kinase
MSHEFKTPLTSIKAATTSLMSSPEQPIETRMEVLRIADEEAERLRALIDDAVEMARLDTTNIEVQLERSNLGEIARDVVTSMQNQIDARLVELACDGEQAMVIVDQRLIRLAIKQLLDNALKYSPPGTPVTIRVRADGGMMMMDVTDYGKGISPAEQSRVFERFWRSPSVQKQMPGSGLGLSIAHRITRAHNGDLIVTSRPGETTFRLILPTEDKGEQE